MQILMWAVVALAVWTMLALVVTPLLAWVLRSGREPYSPSGWLDREFAANRS